MQKTTGIYKTGFSDQAVLIMLTHGRKPEDFESLVKDGNYDIISKRMEGHLKSPSCELCLGSKVFAGVRQ